MNTYKEAVEKLGNRASRKIGNNTYLKRLNAANGGDIIAVMLHATNVLEFHPNGDIVYTSGGWRTNTTKDRLNTYGPASIYQKKGNWIIALNGEEKMFKDGCAITAGGEITGADNITPTADKAKAALLRAAKKYCAAYMEKFMAGELPAPSAGDCFYCSMKTEDGRTLGECVDHGENGHIVAHMKEKYYVPSMITRAADVFGASPMARNYFAYCWNPAAGGVLKASQWEKDIAKDQLGRALYRFVKRGLGFAA